LLERFGDHERRESKEEAFFFSGAVSTNLLDRERGQQQGSIPSDLPGKNLGTFSGLTTVRSINTGGPSPT
jgi:hypothetical protein